MTRRTTLTSVVVGLIGLLFLSFSFVLLQSCAPSNSKMIPNVVNVQGLPPGEHMRFKWNEGVYLAIRLSEEMAADLNRDSALAWRPGINAYRAGDLLVYVPISTYLGCGLTYSPKGKQPEMLPNGGFFDPCHLGRYDFAGRALRADRSPDGSPLSDLRVPRYTVSEDGASIVFNRAQQAGLSDPQKLTLLRSANP